MFNIQKALGNLGTFVCWHKFLLPKHIRET